MYHYDASNQVLHQVPINSHIAAQQFGVERDDHSTDPVDDEHLSELWTTLPRLVQLP